MLKNFISISMFFCSSYGLANIEMTTPGMYSAEDVKHVPDGKSEWQGVVLLNGKWKIRNMPVTKTPVELAEDEHGFDITIKHMMDTKQLAFLARGLNFKNDDEIPALVLGGPLLLDPKKTSIDISFGKINAQIQATGSFDGEKEYVGQAPKNYKISIISDGKAAILDHNYPGKLFYLLWAGDLNNDNFPDILVKPTKDENWPVYLFISKVFGKKVTMTNVGHGNR